MGRLETWERWRDGDTGLPILGLFRIVTAIQDFHKFSDGFDRVDLIVRYPVYLEVSNLLDHLERHGAQSVGQGFEFFNTMDLERRVQVVELVAHLEGRQFFID